MSGDDKAASGIKRSDDLSEGDTAIAATGAMSADATATVSAKANTKGATTPDVAGKFASVLMTTDITDEGNAFCRTSTGTAHASPPPHHGRVRRHLRLADGRIPTAGGSTTTCSRGRVKTWLSVESAARIVEMHPTSFRRQLEKNVYRADDGGTESRFDGIFARKLGGRWKVLLGPRWLNPLSAEGENNNAVRATSPSARPEHTGRSGK